jgi:hypothetical protein
VMQRSVLLTGCVAAVLLVPPSAAAGGWWTSIRLDSSRVAVGQNVRAHADVMFSSVDSVEAAQRERAFYVYLLRGFDYSVVERAMRVPFPRNWWSVGSADAFRVGRVVIRGSESNLALANASFRVPDIPAGEYSVMFCDAGCTHPLADVIPTLPNRFTVTASRTTDASTWVRARWLVVGVILGGLLGFLLGRRSGPAAHEPIVAAWQPSDKELEELLSHAAEPALRASDRAAHESVRP